MGDDFTIVETPRQPGLRKYHRRYVLKGSVIMLPSQVVGLSQRQALMLNLFDDESIFIDDGIVYIDPERLKKLARDASELQLIDDLYSVIRAKMIRGGAGGVSGNSKGGAA